MSDYNYMDDLRNINHRQQQQIERLRLFCERLLMVHEKRSIELAKSIVEQVVKMENKT